MCITCTFRAFFHKFYTITRPHPHRKQIVWTYIKLSSESDKTASSYVVWSIIKEMFYYFLNNCLSSCAMLPYRDMIKKTDYNVVSLITVLIAVYIIKCTVEINEIIFKMYNLFFLFINQLCDQYSIYSALVWYII